MAAPDLDETGIRDLIPISSGGDTHQPRVSAFLVKFTDSSLRALKASQHKTGEACRIEIVGDRGTIVFPSDGGSGAKKKDKDLGGGKFTLAVADIQRDLGVDGKMEVISGVCEDDQLLALGSESEPFATIGGILKKIAINATDTTFDEARQKALRQEEDQRKSAAKEVKQKGLKQHPAAARKSPPLPADGARNASSSSFAANAAASTSKTAGKTLRQRVVHMLAVKQLKMTDILERLKKEGLSSSDLKRFDSVLSDVTVKVGDKLILKPCLLKTEVDVNWPGYGSWEKSTIKSKLKGGPKDQTSSSANSYLGFQKKTEPLPPQAPQPKSSQAPASTTSILDQLMPATDPEQRENAGNLKRKQPPSTGNPTPPHDSAVSPPNTSPDGAGQDLVVPQKKIRLAHGTGVPAPKETSSPKKSPTPPPPPPPLPDDHMMIPEDTPSEPRDWSAEFPEIRSSEERRKYGQAFEAEYEEYGRGHEKLAAVGREFSDLGKKMQLAPKQSKEKKKIEREIITKYQHYLKDEEFMGLKRRHDELREKLAFIKERVKDFDLKQRKKIQASRGGGGGAGAPTNPHAKKTSSPNENRRSGVTPPQDPHPLFQENNRTMDLTVM